MRHINKIICIVILFSMLISACGNNAENAITKWQEQYDLGMSYLEEGDYEQAIVAFTAAIELDPKQIDTYIKIADIYLIDDNFDLALKILQQGLEATDNDATLFEKFTEVEGKKEVKEMKTIITQQSLVFSVDEIVLGETDIAVAKSAYGKREYAKSNLMQDDEFDTVYTCFGMDMPIPEGYEENEFGFLFAAPVKNGIIDEIQSQDEALLCFGTIKVGDSLNDVLELFNIEKYEKVIIQGLKIETDNNKTLEITNHENRTTFKYRQDDKMAWITVDNEKDKIHSISMSMEE